MALRLLSYNLSDGGTWTANQTAVAALPLTNLTDYRRSYITRFLAITSVVLNCEISAKTINSVWIDRHNLDAADLIRIKVYSDAAKTTLEHDSGDLPAVPVKPWGEYVPNDDPWGVSYSDQLPSKVFDYQFADFPCEALEITITRSSSSDTDIGAVYFGKSFEPVTSADYGLALSEIDTASTVRTIGGSTQSITGHRYRRLDFSLSWLTEADRAKLIWQLRNAGKTGVLAVSIYSDNSGQLQYDHSFLANRVSDIKPEHISPNYWRQSISLEEI